MSTIGKNILRGSAFIAGATALLFSFQNCSSHNLSTPSSRSIDSLSSVDSAIVNTGNNNIDDAALLERNQTITHDPNATSVNIDPSKTQKGCTFSYDDLSARFNLPDLTNTFAGGNCVGQQCYPNEKGEITIPYNYTSWLGYWDRRQKDDPNLFTTVPLISVSCEQGKPLVAEGWAGRLLSY